MPLDAGTPAGEARGMEVVLFVPGFFGFGAFGHPDRPLIEYFARVEDALLRAHVRPAHFVVHADPVMPPNAGQTMRLDTSKGRFGFTLNVQQFADRPAVANDVQAGAYFRITPSLRVGGSVAFGDQQLTPRANSARPADAPKVRLESTFKF